MLAPLVNSSDDLYIVHEKKSFKRCLDYARHDRCKLIYYYLVISYVVIHMVREMTPVVCYDCFLHQNADSVEKSCHFAYVLHQNSDSVEKSRVSRQVCVS